MYAIIRTGGKQFRVEPGMTLRVPTIGAEVGAEVELETLLAADGGEVQVGAGLGEIKTVATVTGHGRGDKIIVFKKKRRKQYKRKQGHRQNFTEIQIAS